MAAAECPGAWHTTRKSKRGPRCPICPCPHENFAAHVDVNRLADAEAEDAPVVGFVCDVRVRCADCDEAMVFHGVGLPVGGVLPHRPCVSVDGTELRLPCRPQSSDPSFGLGLTGITMRVRDGSEGSLN